MKNVLFRVHGTRVERLNVYGNLLLLLGVLLNFIEVLDLLGLFVCCSGGWLNWYALKEGLREGELSKQQWVRRPLLVMSIIISILILVLFIGTIFGWR